MPNDNFAKTLTENNLQLLRDTTRTLQVNIGQICNLRCKHCHVNAGPQRKEVMSKETMTQVIEFAQKNSFETADITGGAPEMVPKIEYLVSGLHRAVNRLIFRSNLTLLLNEEYEHLFQLLLDTKTALVASFPSTNKTQADSQRGDGVWQSSIDALKKLNKAGYGIPGTGLKLDLVANPTGAFMPVEQCRAEQKFKSDLARKWDIKFTNLFTFANIPLGRFRTWLENTNNLTPYMDKLSGNFNPDTVEGLMCRSLISVSWDGYLFDCDFNLAAGLYHRGEKRHISTVETIEKGHQITTDNHCYGCTAGAGFT
jgi:radical SAM/Cys-rich protein